MRVRRGRRLNLFRSDRLDTTAVQSWTTSEVYRSFVVSQWPRSSGQLGETARHRLQSATMQGRKKLFQLAELLTLEDPLIDAPVA